MTDIQTETETDTETVTVERDIGFPPEKVWRALTQPHLIQDWLMRTDFEPVVGRRFHLTGDWGGVECEVLVVETNRRLSYRWDHPHEDAAYDLRSVVTFTLTATSGGTHLRMEQVGFRPEQKQALHGAKGGWRQHFDRLEQVLEAMG